MINITTTDSQILISNDGSPASGYPKNSITYTADVNKIYLQLGRITLYSLPYRDVSVNGTTLTSSNYTTAMEALFI
ncbi:hypothetical protein [Dysgonomonas capnocytophagoides]|uniref:hypothetical protein n=1 Tax=Dysgonomonas capnocytophagoides TaxID=45254 RepID=UPI002921DBC9|nr:hypothetical protein DCPSUM001_33230 [Dysgonomonas capnocytophagoides]